MRHEELMRTTRYRVFYIDNIYILW